MTSKTQALPLAAPVTINGSAWPSRLKRLVVAAVILLVLAVV
ncbi:ABC transporter permease, partial [Pseudomonas marginalis]|nr:ABC transporter permease [Pseudomonas marginalis]